MPPHARMENPDPKQKNVPRERTSFAREYLWSSFPNTGGGAVSNLTLSAVPRSLAALGGSARKTCIAPKKYHQLDLVSRKSRMGSAGTRYQAATVVAEEHPTGAWIPWKCNINQPSGSAMAAVTLGGQGYHRRLSDRAAFRRLEGRTRLRSCERWPPGPGVELHWDRL